MCPEFCSQARGHTLNEAHENAWQLTEGLPIKPRHVISELMDPPSTHGRIRTYIKRILNPPPHQGGLRGL